MSKFFWNYCLIKYRALSDSSWHEPPCEDLSDVYQDDSDDSDENLSNFLEEKEQSEEDNMEFEEIPVTVVPKYDNNSLSNHKKNFKQNYCTLIWCNI